MNNKTVELVNKYIADTGVLFIKWHNLHWNVVGSQFKSVHEFIEGLYDALADVLDESAELLKMHEQQPLASLKEYLAVTTIKELDSKEIKIEDALNIVIEDMLAMNSLAKEIREEANKEDLFDLVSMMEDHIGNYNKNIWFLKATIK